MSKLAKNLLFLRMAGWPGGRPGGWITLGIMQTQPPTELELGLGLSLAIKANSASQQSWSLA